MTFKKKRFLVFDTIACRFAFCVSALFVGSLITESAAARELNITARFSANQTNLSVNKFVNTTPNGGICRVDPSKCPQGVFSLGVYLGSPSFPIAANTTDVRKGLMIKASTEWRDVEVRHSNGDVQVLRTRLTGAGGKIVVSPGVVAITGGGNSTTLWVGGDLTNAPAPCTYGSNQVKFGNALHFLWRISNNSTCAKTSRFFIPDFSFESFYFMYELETPHPTRMSSGVYTGQTSYRMGPGEDIDFGDKNIPLDRRLGLNFTLTVNHVIKVLFPANADKLALVPEGGWLQWLNHSRKPAKLFANQSFQITSSSPFNMKLNCQYFENGHCAIRNGRGDIVPVNTSVTLPTGLRDNSGQVVSRRALSTLPVTVRPNSYVDDARAYLHFEVTKENVERMLERPGSVYKGSVTVIWDTQI